MRKFSTLASIILVALFYPPVFAETPNENLIDIYELALKNDPEFRAQQASLEAELETRFQANANYARPVVSISANADRNFQDIDAEFGGGSSQFEAYGYTLNLSQPIYHRDRYIHLQQVDDQIKKAQFDLDAVEQNLMLRTAERYFAVLSANDNLAFTQAEKSSLEKQLEESNKRFEVGLIPITDVQEAQAGFDLAHAREIRAYNTLDDTREALREITGRYPGSLSTLTEEVISTKPVPDDIDAWTQSALENNLQLKASLVEVDIAEKQIKRQDAGHYPTVDLVGNHGFRSSGGQFGNTEIDFTKFGVELNIPIYEGGQVLSRTREAMHRHDQALEILEQTRRSVDRKTRESYRGILSGISQISAFNQAVLSSKTAVDATKMGVEIGTRTTVDVITAEQEFFRARKDYSQARYEYILDTLRLKQALGKLSPEDIKQVNSLLSNQEISK
ncbi:MAG: TolC family outer membrane protein [Gammaproteobacteria bacterium]